MPSSAGTESSSPPASPIHDFLRFTRHTREYVCRYKSSHLRREARDGKFTESYRAGEASRRLSDLLFSALIGNSKHLGCAVWDIRWKEKLSIPAQRAAMFLYTRSHIQTQFDIHWEKSFWKITILLVKPPQTVKTQKITILYSQFYNTV